MRAFLCHNQGCLNPSPTHTRKKKEICFFFGRVYVCDKWMWLIVCYPRSDFQRNERQKKNKTHLNPPKALLKTQIGSFETSFDFSSILWFAYRYTTFFFIHSHSHQINNNKNTHTPVIHIDKSYQWYIILNIDIYIYV